MALFKQFTRTGEALFQGYMQHWLTRRQLTVSLVLLRYSLGLGQTYTRIGRTRIMQLCGIRKDHVGNTLKYLLERKIIRQDSKGQLAFNNPSHWRVKKLVESQQTPSCESFIMFYNHILEGLYEHRFSRRQLVVMLALVRYSYGYDREEAPAGCRIISKMTGIQTNHVATTLRDLLKTSVIKRQGYGVYVINPPEQWQIAHNSEKPKKKAVRPNKKPTQPVESTPVEPETPEPVLPEEAAQPATNHSEQAVTLDNGHTTVDLFGDLKQTDSTGGDTPAPRAADNPLVAGQQTAPEASVESTSKRKRKPREKTDGSRVWEAYAMAYKTKYNIDPVRNAKVNKLCAELVRRVGAEDAPKIAAWYLTQGGFHAKRLHPLDLLIRDAESMRTLWATNRQIDPRNRLSPHEVSDILMANGIQPGQLSEENERTLAVLYAEHEKFQQAPPHQGDPKSESDSHLEWLLSG